jgi:hypothetical protein
MTSELSVALPCAETIRISAVIALFTTYSKTKEGSAKASFDSVSV